MGLFTRQDSGIDKLHFFIKMAFERVRDDMHNIFSWVDYFHQKHSEHDQRLMLLEQSLAHKPDQTDEVKQIIDSHYPYEHILRKIEELNRRIDDLETKRTEKKSGLKERLFKKVSKNSKEYIKSVILGTIKKYNRISGPQLKEIIVEEQGLCSKSSFYRMLNEIEEEHNISSFTDGKEKTYFLNAKIVK